MKKLTIEILIYIFLICVSIKIYIICQEMNSLVGTEGYSFIDHSSWSEIFMGSVFINILLTTDIVSRIRKLKMKTK